MLVGLLVRQCRRDLVEVKAGQLGTGPAGRPPGSAQCGTTATSISPAGPELARHVTGGEPGVHDRGQVCLPGPDPRRCGSQRHRAGDLGAAGQRHRVAGRGGWRRVRCSLQRPERRAAAVAPGPSRERPRPDLPVAGGTRELVTDGVPAACRPGRRAHYEVEGCSWAALASCALAGPRSTSPSSRPPWPTAQRGTLRPGSQPARADPWRLGRHTVRAWSPGS